MTRISIIGGGPGGYEAALVAAQHGASVTLIDSDGIGGSAVLTDCVPSKALIAVSEMLTTATSVQELGVTVAGVPDMAAAMRVDLARANLRVRRLAEAQSRDTRLRLEKAGVHLIDGHGRLDGPNAVIVRPEPHGRERRLPADMILLATGARPRELPSAPTDGERILNWVQLYDLTELPEHLIVVGSGVTGAEFASAYRALGSRVTLVSSRDRVLPGEDPDAAEALEEAFARRGVSVQSRARAASVRRITWEEGEREGVEVLLTDGTRLVGSHCLMAVGSIPNTDDLGLESAGVLTDDSGFITVDRVSRTSVPSVYAAGDCTGVLMLASVAAMQGRIAMWHLLGETVHPLDRDTVPSNIFTDPEIAAVGCSQADVDEGLLNAVGVTLPFRTNARAKMQGLRDGFVKLFCRTGTRIVVGGVIVAPRASELIQSVTLAVNQRMTVDELAETITVYPSLSGSIAEAARRLHRADA